jgi:heme-degrading monooxygenase HmoA
MPNHATTPDAAASTIRAGGSGVTLINVFSVDPEHQAELIDLLGQAAERVMRRQPGFISANMHRSLDGTRVVNYMQWESMAAFEATFDDPEAQAQRARIGAVAAGYEMAPYEVSSVHHGPGQAQA